MPLWTLAAAADAHGGGGQTLIDALIILATAGVAAIVMRRVRLEVVPAYLIAGAIVGPHALGLVADPENLDAISRSAIILLMFGIGLHLDLSMLKSGVGGIIASGVGSTVLSAALLWPALMLFGLPAPAALAVALALAISSTAVPLRLLAERRELRRPIGRMTSLIAILQDLLSVLILLAIPAIARWSGAAPQADAGAAEGMNRWASLLADASLRAGGVAAIIVFGRLLLPRLLREAAAIRSNEVMIVLSTATALGAALATQAIGFSAELGAFMAGLLLSATPFRHQLAGQIGPLRDLFIAVFFTAVGMRLDAHAVATGWPLVLFGTGVMLALKAGVIGFTCWGVGAPPTTALAVGLGLAQAGEFSLVLLDVARGKGAIDARVLAQCTAMVAISLIVTPSLFKLADRLRPRALRIRPAPWVSALQLSRLVEKRPTEGDGHGAPDTQDVAAAAFHLRHVVLAGYGVVGRAVADRLDTMGIRYTIIEYNPSTVEKQIKMGRSIVYGDAANADVLESAGVRHADAVILTIPDEDAVLRACQTVRAIRPDAFIAARTNFLSKGMLATRLGADHVTVEEIATAEAMAWEVTKQLAERAMTGKLAPTTHIAAGQPPADRPSS